MRIYTKTIRVMELERVELTVLREMMEEAANKGTSSRLIGNAQALELNVVESPPSGHPLPWSGQPTKPPKR